MTSRLRRSGQVMVLQKRNLLSGNELFEMMRSRQVYYVQNELRKDLDRTLRALKQAEKMELAGLRIQKAIFLKRKIVLDMKKRRLKNGLVATKNKTSIYNHLQSANRGSTIVAERKRGCQASSTIIQNSSVVMPRQANSINQLSTMHNGHRTNCDGMQAGRDRPLAKSGETTQGAIIGSTVNSEWMRSIQEKLQKLNLQADYETDDLAEPHNHCEDKPRTWEIRKQQSGDKDIQTTDTSILSNNNSSNNNNNNSSSNNQKNDDLSKMLLKTGGDNKIIERCIGEKRNDETARFSLSQEVHLGKNNAKLRLDEPTAEIKYLHNIREKDQIKRNSQSWEFSVAHGMQVLSRNERSNKLQQTNSQFHLSNKQGAETNPDRGHSHWPKTKETPLNHAVPHKDVSLHQLTGSVDREGSVLEADNVQCSLDVNKKSKQLQLNLTEESASKSNVNTETNFKPVNMSQHLTRRHVLPSPGVAYLDRSSRQIPEKSSILPADQGSANSGSSPVMTYQYRSKRHPLEKLSVPLADQDIRNYKPSPGMANQDRSQRYIPDKLNVLLSNQDSKNSRSSSGMANVDRPKRHTPDKLNVMLADQNSRNSRSPAGSLERTVTMIFVEDPSGSLQDPPKSHFDFEAWLAYNKRKRGYTQIFDDKSSIVTSEDASTVTSTAQGRKTSSKNHHVRFHFPKRLALSTPRTPGMLTFREKSKEWYLNFLKKNNRHSEKNKDLQSNIQVRKYVSSQLSYALLPSIGSRSDDRTGDCPSYDRSRINHTLSRESTGEQIQRLKEHSRRLRAKVHDFVYS